MSPRLLLLMRSSRTEKLNLADLVWTRLKTRIFYKPLFGSLGAGTALWRPLLLNNTHCVFLGKKIIIRGGARFDIVTERFGQVFTPKVIVGDGALFEQGFHLACGASIHIGERVTCSRNVSILDVWHHYEDIQRPIIDQPLGTAPISVGDGTLIGMGSVILPGVTIGRHCMIGANSVVNRDVPDFCVAVGAPVRVVRRYDPVQQAWIKAGP